MAWDDEGVPRWQRRLSPPSLYDLALRALVNPSVLKALSYGQEAISRRSLPLCPCCGLPVEVVNEYLLFSDTCDVTVHEDGGGYEYSLNAAVETLCNDCYSSWKVLHARCVFSGESACSEHMRIVEICEAWGAVPRTFVWLCEKHYSNLEPFTREQSIVYGEADAPIRLLERCVIDLADDERQVKKKKRRRNTPTAVRRAKPLFPKCTVKK